MRKQDAIVLLELLYEEEINHLRLRVIRDNQAPRFAKLVDELRKKMMGILTAYIESEVEEPDETDEE